MSYRQKARRNPFSDHGIPHPLSPEEIDWSEFYPILKQEKNRIIEPYPTILDIECGYGDLSFEISKLFPDSLVLAFDIRNSVTQYVAKKIDELRKIAKAENVAVQWGDTMRTLMRYIKPHSIDNIFIYLQDPKLISQQLMDEYAYILKDNAMIYLITDVKTYFDCAIPIIESHPLFQRIENPGSDKSLDNVINAIKEIKKVTKNGRTKYIGVFTRISDDEDHIQNVTKKKRGRPPKIKAVVNEKSLNSKKTKKVDNEKRMMELENPYLRSVGNQRVFSISIPNSKQINQQIMSFFESNQKAFDYHNVNCEQMSPFTINFLDNSKSNEDQSEGDEEEPIPIEHENHLDNEGDGDEEILVEMEDQNDNDDVEINNKDDNTPNLDFKACFENSADIHAYLSFANSIHRIKLANMTDENYLLFECACKNCSYQVECRKGDNGYYINHQSKHNCSHVKKIATNEIKKLIVRKGRQTEVNIDYYNSICKSLKVPLTDNMKKRIRNNYNTTFGLDRDGRLESWCKLESFIEIIISRGGLGKINKNKDNLIDFVGFVPDYAATFMHSELFFPVVQIDTRFQNGISAGHLYTIITLTGDRTILPIAAAWAPTESSFYTDMLFNMLERDILLIKTCHSDEGRGLISSIDKSPMSNHLCVWHMSKKCPNKEMFIQLVNATNSHEYEQIKYEICFNSKYKELKSYLDAGNRWNKISRFESSTPRDSNLATSSVESLNAYIKRKKLKNKEPLEVFINIYNFGYDSLLGICLQTNFLTNSVSDWLSYALYAANKLEVIQISNFGRFYVKKDTDSEPTCTVECIPRKRPSCTCMFYEDCGMPCIHLLAVACRYQMNWVDWIHCRYFCSKYKNKFYENYEPADFHRIVSKGMVIPVNVRSLKQRQNRFTYPGEVK